MAADRHTPVSAAPTPSAPTPSGRVRWAICALLFFATTINYIDRQVTGILGPTLQLEFGWNEKQYADVTAWWTAAYGIGFLFVGRFIDRVGVRVGFAVAVVVWSLAGAAHGLVATVAGFGIARFLLGLGEAGNFPAAIKATAEWFPRHERAFATGIFNAGSNVGAVITALIVPWITLHYGWRQSFIVTGAFGFVWLLFWWPMYRSPAEHPRITTDEHRYITNDGSDRSVPAQRVRWYELLTHRQSWVFIIGKFMTDGVWWFYLFWLPKFLDKQFGITLGKLALPIIIIYIVADVGSVGGGWMSGWLISRGWDTARARKRTLLTAALLIVPTALSPLTDSLWVAVTLVSIAAAAHQWWSANLFTLTSDMFPQHAVASVVGLGGFAGALGGFLFQRLTGVILESTGGNYVPVFLMCGSAYVSALLLMHLLLPRLTPVTLGAPAPRRAGA